MTVATGHPVANGARDAPYTPAWQLAIRGLHVDIGFFKRPAKAEIDFQRMHQSKMDSRFRGNDGPEAG